eukprot:4629310-Karenia_brevis.AAC.1
MLFGVVPRAPGPLPTLQGAPHPIFQDPEEALPWRGILGSDVEQWAVIPAHALMSIVVDSLVRAPLDAPAAHKAQDVLRPMISNVFIVSTADRLAAMNTKLIMHAEAVQTEPHEFRCPRAH